MKMKFAALLLAIAVCFSLAPTVSFAEIGPRFSMKVSDVNAAVAQEVQVTVSGEGLADLYGYDVRLTYDTDKLRYKSVSASWAGFSVPIEKDGTITFAHTKVGPVTGENGAKDIATFVFETLSSGEALVTLAQATLVNSKNEPATTLSLSLKATIQVKTEIKQSSFLDVNGHWAESNIERAVELGIVNGYPDRTFRPEGQVTRGEFIAMLARAVELPDGNRTTVAFTDVDKIPAWARPLVNKAASSGIIHGYADGTFRAGNLISRSEMAVIIARTLQLQLDGEAAATFADADQIPAWAMPSVVAAVDAKLIQGRSNNLFAPASNATRAEAVTLLLSLIDYQG